MSGLEFTNLVGTGGEWDVCLCLVVLVSVRVGGDKE